jgi:cytoskeletal protein CcmA (bactofilin family)
VSYFSQPKNEKSAKSSANVVALDTAEATQGPMSMVGPGMTITGNIVCTGAMQVFGRVVGEVHAARLDICKGAQVEGTVMALEAVIDGAFKGTIHGNSVKLQATAVVDGEIINKSLTIEQDAQFEGVARRLEKAIEAPTLPRSLPSAEVVPITRAAELGTGNLAERV